MSMAKNERLIFAVVTIRAAMLRLIATRITERTTWAGCALIISTPVTGAAADFVFAALASRIIILLVSVIILQVWITVEFVNGINGRLDYRFKLGAINFA